ncbi:MogA/MoaB family molybdenum cofactor biosynthesis protein [Haloglycomyces albus]|uniref:MogA/MoaB family molybdenum cofactor biosynthesis protein n=1 Tax=Haloglycomyces albus TaxID=526067 RepID=UPI000684AA21|nr:molybdenum cofactor synthesis domain-containing protein [Haloglycomyces albus]
MAEVTNEQRSPCGELTFTPRARVIVASTRAATGVYQDKSGPLLVQGLREAEFDVDDPVVVADGADVETAIKNAVTDRIDVVLTSGGTGLTPTDTTPDITRRIIAREVPGLAEAIRAYGVQKIPQAVLSRGIAGSVGTTLIVNLAGSSGAARDGLAVLTPDLLRHCVSQLHGGDHERNQA